jgi:hypothetical protein
VSDGDQEELAVITFLLLGCARLGELDGSDLEAPAASVYSFDESGNVMLVFSDQPDLCDLLGSAEPPTPANWWVVSAWTRNGAKEEQELSVDGFATIQLFAQAHDYTATEGTLKISNVQDQEIQGHLELRFPTGDTLSNHYRADYCDAALFVGLEEQ